MAGRRPKPTRLKILTGNPGKKRLPVGEPQPDVEALRCPKWLSDGAKAEWRRTVPKLVKLRITTNVDRGILEGYCEAHAEFEESTRLIKEQGHIIEEDRFNRDGEKIGTITKVNPLVRVRREALILMRQYATELGMTPASRPKLAGAAKPKEQNSMRAFLNV